MISSICHVKFLGFPWLFHGLPHVSHTKNGPTQSGARSDPILFLAHAQGTKRKARGMLRYAKYLTGTV